MLKDRCHNRGTALVLVAVFLAALLAFAALSIDMARVYQQQRNLHAGTDAAALAGVAALTNRPQRVDVVIELATAVAAANHVTTAEIAASTEGEIQVGIWNPATRTFVPNATSNGYYNAVKVPARREVPLYFGRVVGLESMSPSVRSVAVIDLARSAYAIPFAITTNLLAEAKDGIISTIGKQSAGNWGVITKLSGSGDVLDAIVRANAFFVLNEVDYPVDPGVDGVREAFRTRWRDPELREQIFVLPIVNDFPAGSSSPVRVMDFQCVKLAGPPGGSGNNLNLRFEIVPNCLLGADPGGTASGVYARVLVE